MREAMLYSKESGSKVRCRLCRHTCLIDDGKVGICNVRKNEGGVLRPIFYARPISMAVDPIEKKPLFHYLPGTRSFSIACPGCNFRCPFCQNWEISQYGREDSVRAPSMEVAPEKVVAEAVASSARSISYTYTEPTIFFEYAFDIAVLAKKKGLGNIFVTNGYMTREAIDAIAPYLDAANVDLKAFKRDTYRNLMKASLDGVLDSIRYMKEKGIWIEVTTLVVSGMNDGADELSAIANFLVQMGRDIPWHISRCVPHYRMDDIPQTPIATLKQAYEIGKKAGLRYVYLGNVAGDETEGTFCYECGERLIERAGYRIVSNRLENHSSCPKCKAKIDGIFFR
jgi:pyruvate formate lyase activating enzyme